MLLSSKTFLCSDTLVDAVTVCPQGQFLLIGERNGSLHIIFVPLKKTVLTKVITHFMLTPIMAYFAQITKNLVVLVNFYSDPPTTKLF